MLKNSDVSFTKRVKDKLLPNKTTKQVSQEETLRKMVEDSNKRYAKLQERPRG